MAYASKSVETVLEDIGALDLSGHARWRVYPQNIGTQGILLTAAAVANTFGNWVEVVPLNTVLFIFDVIGLVVEEVSAIGFYHFQLGYNIINADPGANMEMGERRIRIVGFPINRETELLHIHSHEVPANSRIMGRLKTASGVADTARISIALTRHVQVSREVALWPAFPW